MAHKQKDMFINEISVGKDQARSFHNFRLEIVHLVRKKTPHRRTPVLESLFNKQAFRPATLLKRDSDTGVFLRIFKTTQDHPFWKTSANSCFFYCMILTGTCFPKKLAYFPNGSSLSNLNKVVLVTLYLIFKILYSILLLFIYCWFGHFLYIFHFYFYFFRCTSAVPKNLIIWYFSNTMMPP